jgi:cysteine desulfurase
VATEHKCVLESARLLKAEGFDVTFLGVGGDGLIDPGELDALLAKRPDTAVVSVMYVNNEIGVIQPIPEVGAICAKHGVQFHTDAAQAVGKLPLDLHAAGAGLASISGHKMSVPEPAPLLGSSVFPSVRLSDHHRPRLTALPQVRPQGRWRALRVAPAPRAHRADPVRRRAGARAPVRHAVPGAGRGPRRRGRARRRGDGA